MSERGVLTAVFGVTGTGKGQWVIHHELMRKKVSLVWDLKGDKTEYTGSSVPLKNEQKIRAYSLRDLKLCIAKVSKGIICYSEKGAGKAQFFEFCRLAMLFAEIHGSGSAVVIDETSSVTNPGKAGDAYGELIRTGLNRGADFYVMCQRGAESDKTAIHNSSRFHFSSVGGDIDVDRMAKDSRVPRSVVAGLVADHKRKVFEYVDVVKNISWQKGVLSFPRGRACFKASGNEIFFNNRSLLKK